MKNPLKIPVQTFLESCAQEFVDAHPDFAPIVLSHWFEQGCAVAMRLQRGINEIRKGRFAKVKPIVIKEEGKTDKEVEDEYTVALEEQRIYKKSIEKQCAEDENFVRVALGIEFDNKFKKTTKLYKPDRTVCVLAFLAGARVW